MTHCRAALLVLVSVLVAGCPARPPPLDFGARGRITDPDEVLAALQARHSSLHSVTGEAKASIDTPEGGGALDQFVIAERPGNVRLESLSFFGSPVAVLTTDGVQFQLHEVDANRFHVGDATARNISRLLPVAVSPEDLVSLLLGVPPLPDDARARSLSVNEQRRAYVLTLAFDGALHEYGFDPLTLRPMWARLSAGPNRSAYLVEFGDYRGDHDLPRRVRLVGPGGKRRIELVWRNREINAPVDSSVFTQPVPRNAEVIAQ